ncbi:MAG TPA: efflux RND transporter periplasmic adaptor subunit [Bryobacteraceae bacterium]|nr:efflux RND transporter periplasmic adaptor subunit [Bryobacteraceae bacterium]
MTNWHTLAFRVLVTTLIALVFSACGTKTTPKAEAAAIRNPMEITPGADLTKQIKIGQPQSELVSSTLRVAGRVEADGTRMARISAPVTGRILELKVIEGQHVSKGEVLARIYSTELSGAQSEFLKAHSERQVAERAVSRAKQLLDAGVIGSAELQRREAELQQATADLSAARERLRVLGMQDDGITTLQNSRTLSSITDIVSSIDGIMLERKATIGQIVQAVEPVFVIADLSHVWLVADVPEQSAGHIEVGKLVRAEIPALPGQKITGKLSFVSAMVNPETRTVTTRMNLPNPTRIFKPAMLTTMTLIDGSEQRLVVPASSVVREGNNDCVFVQTVPTTYLLRPVSLGEDLGDKRVVLEGVRAGEKIVTEGAFHLNNERKRLALGGEEGS